MTSALKVLQTTFGFSHFREPQQAIIDAVVAGNDAFVLMPTGGGKSLCYQIPAVVRPGCGVVISPLIALMQDQVSALQQLGIRASFLNSTLDAHSASAVEQALLSGELDLLYLAPERLNQSRTRALLDSATLSLFAIDEAHCVSQWGHDFRADYLQLEQLQHLFPSVPRVALTATADPRTQQEIVDRLGLEQAAKFIVGFDRPNIQYRIGLKNNPRQQLLRFLKEEHPTDAGIIYCLSRKKTEEIAQWLTEQGFDALPYHAGLSAELRAAHQARFLRDDSVIVVATIAFGMGIDKPDVRFVVHLDLPKTVESYYQETGRAGRDGAPATAWMIYGLQDVIKLRQMMQGSQGSDQHKRLEQHRLNAMLGLCEITSCRRQSLLQYFGEDYPQPCGNCDSCLDPAKTWDATEACRMALSALARTVERFGVNHLIDVLRGKETDKMWQFEHHLLPTFGVGTALDNHQWRSVFRQLVGRSYLSVDVEGYGALKLQAQCRPLLRGEVSIALRLDQKQKVIKRQTKTTLPAEIDVGMWEALRECRREQAEEQGVPPYVIFHDSTLIEMCATLPQTLDEFAKLSGVGERKLLKYGDAFLVAIRRAQDEFST